MSNEQAQQIPEEMAACMAAAELKEEHTRLAAFVGDWKAQIKVWFGGPESEPHESTGVMTNELDLGGRFLKQTYNDDAGQFHGRGYWGYNTVDSVWEGFWIDDMATFFQFERGSYDAEHDRWEMTGSMTDPGSGAPMTKRSVITRVSDDEHTMEVFFAPQGAPESKGMEMRYTRA